MTNKQRLKVHTPIGKWKQLHEHVRVGDIVHVSLPIEQESMRFRLLKDELRLEFDEGSSMEAEEMEYTLLEHLSYDDWSSQFIGYAYPLKDKLVLYAVYDLNFHVYLDAITVQKLAKTYHFSPHPILYHGAVKPVGTETVSEFLMREVGGSNKAPKSRVRESALVVENVSRFREYRRIIGTWTMDKKAEPPVKKETESEDKTAILSS